LLAGRTLSLRETDRPLRENSNIKKAITNIQKGGYQYSKGLSPILKKGFSFLFPENMI